MARTSLPLRDDQACLGAMILQQRRRLPHRRQQGNRFDSGEPDDCCYPQCAALPAGSARNIFQPFAEQEEKAPAAAMPKERWRLYAEPPPLLPRFSF